jgi:hypothetical protein
MLQLPKGRNPTFKALMIHVGLGRWLPFYNFSSAALHGLSRGFYRLGLPAEKRGIPLCWGSNVGLADPLQNTAIFLNMVTVCLLTQEPDDESLLVCQVMNGFPNDIGR